ncbi:polymorphic toxin type 15 domain-containing protein [Saccharothrix sp. HUAS TT1]|uniref:polymorphic toxin type 15 domain-containing protein n=1 Tax=unclassified Saccharothrix TaxID=2593673 RepID=UPI00345C45A6
MTGPKSSSTTDQAPQSQPRKPRAGDAQGVTGLLQPDEDHDYVRVDVRGDGSCLFYSVVLAAAGANLLPTLSAEPPLKKTTDEVRLDLRRVAAAQMGVDLAGFDAVMEAYQWRERAAIAHHWTQNPARFAADLRGDITSVIIGFLQNLKLVGAIYAQASVPSATAAVDVDGDNPAPQQAPDDNTDDSFSFESEDEDDDDPQVAAARRTRRLAFLTGIGTQHVQDQVVRAEAPLAQDHLIVEDDLRQRGLFADKKPGGTLFAWAISGRLANAISLAHQVRQTGIGSLVRVNSPFAREIKLLVLDALQSRLADPNADVLAPFNGGEFANHLDALIPHYIAEFAATKVYAGQAALAALNDLHGLEIETHSYHGSYQRLFGTDSASTVKVLETPGHFQVLCGPFEPNHLLPPGSVKAPAHESALSGTTSLHLWDNVLELTQLSARAEGKRVVVLAKVHGRRRPAARWLRELIEDGHLLADSLGTILADVEALEEPPYDGGLLSEFLQPFSAIAQKVYDARSVFEHYFDVDLEVEVESGFEEITTLQVVDGVILTNQLVPLESCLARVLRGPLGTGRTLLGAELVHGVMVDALGFQSALDVDQVEEAEGMLRSVGEALHELSAQLGVDSLFDACRRRPMEPLFLPFGVFWPTAKELAKFGIAEVFDEDAFVLEVERQVGLQQIAINRLGADEWMINRDTFNLKVGDRREKIIGNRSGSYLDELARTLLLRNAEIGDEKTRKRKRAWMEQNNKKLAKLVPATDPLTYLMARAELVHDTAQGMEFDPEKEHDTKFLADLLEDILGAVVETDAVDEDGVPLTAMVAGGLVGRSNSQGGWRRVNLDKLAAAVEAMRDDWSGLLPPVDPGNPLAGLAALHNPDQVAGGVRDLPAKPEDITDHIGPGVVNSALGATWGLRDQKDLTAPTTANLLEEVIRDRHPEATWPLLVMNVVLVVQVGDGAHVPPSKPNKRVKK